MFSALLIAWHGDNNNTELIFLTIDQHILALFFSKVTWQLDTSWHRHATPGQRSPLPRHQAQSAALAHPLERSLRLLHLIVDGVQTFLYVVKLLCKHHHSAVQFTFIINHLYLHCQWRTKSNAAIIPLKHFYKTTQHFPVCNFTSHQGADKLCDTKHYEPTFIIHRNNVSDLSQWRTRSILPPWSSRATNVFIPASLDWRRGQLLAGRGLAFI